jgi:hypothetical protein
MTWSPRCWLWVSSVWEASLPCSAAAAASASILTPVMVSATLLVPCAANCVLRFVRRGALLLHRGGDCGRDLVDPADHAADSLNCVDRFAA